ncbi:MAG: crossover junction endodeoxyribonuclease RuvC [Rhabdochlamydiaceae bacterium]|nr:crossover junction endodeoxyribonuclease RuvC [Rhabdochlamydiaceae bacterium]
MNKETKAPLILGIDPGTRITGYGLIKVLAAKHEAIDFGCIRPPVQAETAQRYLALFNALEQLIEKYQPDAVAVETQFVYKNVQSALKLGMARGVVMLAASRRNIPVFEYAPKKAKLAVVGNGSASKQQVQKMIQLLLRLPQPPEPEDAADALALAICHAHTLQFNRRVAHV